MNNKTKPWVCEKKERKFTKSYKKWKKIKEKTSDNESILKLKVLQPEKQNKTKEKITKKADGNKKVTQR